MANGKRKERRQGQARMDHERVRSARKPPGVHWAEQAFEAGCAHWVALDTPYLVLPSGRTRCGVCGLTWATSKQERQELLGGRAVTGTR
jgi:hypothetical protein